MKGVCNMKKLILLVALLVITTGVFAQGTDLVYIPRTLSAGTSMSARSVSSTYDDTTQAVLVKGYSQVGVVLVTATNDSCTISVSYQGSMDGSTFGQFQTLIDSLSSTGTVGVNKGFALPDAGMNFTFVRFRVYSNTASGRFSSAPAVTATTYIVKKQSNR